MAGRPSKSPRSTASSTKSASPPRHNSPSVRPDRIERFQTFAQLRSLDANTAVRLAAFNASYSLGAATLLYPSTPENDMNAKVTSSVGSKKTRTGRISKAAKGLRVHHCDECGKTYTRAEHLRRHQQNHKPGEFPCDHPGCKRSFYREDLLARHQLRHSESFDLEHTFSTLPSPALQSSQLPQTLGVPIPVASYAPIAESNVVTSAALAVSAPFILQPSPPGSFYLQNDVRSTETSPLAQLPPPVAPVAQQHEYAIATGWQSAPHSQSPTAFESPLVVPTHQNNVQNGFGTRPIGHTAMFSGQPTYNLSHSPTSSATPVQVPHQPIYGSQGRHTYPTASPLISPLLGRSDSMVDVRRGSFGGQPLLPAISNASAFQMMSADERDLLEQVDLALLVTFSEDAEEPFFLNAYWELIHPLYPIVHRSQFASSRPNPLLKTAMLALGAHALRTKASIEKARVMHEQCTKILHKRTNNKWHTSRVCDLQAVILVELFALFRSRRPALQLSTWFMDAYRTLANDVDAFQPDAETTRAHGASAHQAPEITRATIRTKQHLLLTCYFISQTWVTLFGRRRAIQSPVVGTQLPFPRRLATFDEITPTGRDSSLPLSQSEKVWQVIASILNEANPRRGNLDSFQSLVLISAIIDPDSDPRALGVDKGKQMSFALVRQAMEQSARCKMTWHILMLCKNTPVRALLAVAGESWVLGEKLGSAEEYAAAQLKTRNWAKGFPGPGDDYNTGETQLAIERAFHHAKQALDIHRNEPQTGLPFQEWAIYLAGLVVWARGYLSSVQARQAKALLNIREPDIQAEVQNGRFDDHELEQSMLYLAKTGGGNGHHSSRMTRCVLLWIRGRIEGVDVPHSCGITNSAQDVLMKLVLRGDADGWFG